jgi:hypothetical protein
MSFEARATNITGWNGKESTCESKLSAHSSCSEQQVSHSLTCGAVIAAVTISKRIFLLLCNTGVTILYSA